MQALKNPFILLIIYSFASSSILAQINYPDPGKGCLTTGCHEGVEPIREHHSGMAKAIYRRGLELGDANGCIVCHFGDAGTANKDEAHRGVIRFPASMWVLDRTCAKCHKDHSYAMHRNLMQTEAGKIQGAVWGWGALTGYESIYGNYAIDDPDGTPQPSLHGKKYQFVQDDFHHSLEGREGNPRGRILCQDCHHSTDVHGNGNIGGTTFGEVEIECFDCHGTPLKHPWELPLGYGEEYGMPSLVQNRGVALELLAFQEKFGTTYEVEDGYLLTARGNPFGNVVRRDDGVVVHSASGLDFNVPVLKNLVRDDGFRNPVEATTAMVGVKKHLQTMECYTCHTSWAAQCYGCHVKVDYSKRYESLDWVASGNNHFGDGEMAETRRRYDPVMMPGKITEGRTYTRHEDPILGINGEGRVSPFVSNKIWRTPPNIEGGGEAGQRGIDMTPAQPHTVTARARPCVSCHANPKALGYGISDDAFMNGYEAHRYADVQNENGELLSRRSTPQVPMIDGLDMDLSQIVTREGEQVQTVGHHWNLSGPLSAEQREHMERVGTCIACHQEIPDGNLAVSALVRTGKLLNISPHSDEEHASLLNRDLKLAATVQILTPIIVLVFIFLLWKHIRSKTINKLDAIQ